MTRTTLALLSSSLLILAVSLVGCADEGLDGGAGAGTNAGANSGGENSGGNNGENSGENSGDNNGGDNNDGDNSGNNANNDGGGDNSGDNSSASTCSAEVCDGEDNDCDGEVDEIGCACTADTACYGGPPGTRGFGVCADGARACDGTGEFFGPCAGWTGPEEEACDDGLDNDCDGVIDNGCAPVCIDMELCGDGVDNNCDGAVDENCALCDDAETCNNGVDDDCNGGIDDGCATQQCGDAEICDNGLDDDCNGVVDDNCNAAACAVGLQRACFGGDPPQIDVGICRAGVQSCDDATLTWGACAGEVLPGDEVCDNNLDDNCNGQVDEDCFVCQAEEICDNGIDDNCDGQIDEGCDVAIEIPLNINGDCVTTMCPPEAPYPVGCSVFFDGGDERGCVASSPESSTVYFQEGDACGAGRVSGTLLCSSTPGEGLTENTCTINKDRRFYPTSRNGCPDTSG